MPEGCNVILDSLISTNGKSFGAIDFELAFDFKLFLSEFVAESQEVFKQNG